MKTLMSKRSRPSIGKPAMCHARKERVLLIGTDQRITSGPAARTAASRGRIHGWTRIGFRKVRLFSLAPRAPSIHGRFCCKSPFALVIKNSPGFRRDFRVKMWETSSPDDKLTGDLGNVIETVKIGGRQATLDFCNNSALGVFHCDAQNFDAIGGTADIDWPLAPDRLRG